MSDIFTFIIQLAYASSFLGILGELAKGELLDTSVKRVDGMTLGEAISKYDITKKEIDPEASRIYHRDRKSVV